jgi:hypothetical protein
LRWERVGVFARWLREATDGGVDVF